MPDSTGTYVNEIWIHQWRCYDNVLKTFDNKRNNEELKT
jgi:hypothetical protein